ncbi:hypothetical protein PUV54_14280 [Hyphococcus flavus]|uniref:Uncharacterized protein n=1 Tax=Hyphococcus flavus TaxID=1866326 RepID=A0AAE9ZAY6_9PROT|nr:hypothetical protein [Hyphococcus flavus]WDI31119.1 hypothetical protein PUV54_14280 [Hyphococcus flavus]
MTPAGYMLKTVLFRPSWIKNHGVNDIFAVSSCFSKDFVDYINYWRHNGYWLFNAPADMDEIIAREGADRSKLTLFYYEVYEYQFDNDEKTWSKFDVEQSFETNVVKSDAATLQGFDVVSFSVGTNPECSPLSCNSLADELPVNRHCLFRTFYEAKEALISGKFDDAEPGPFRIFAIYSVET